jgi:hypothetical protein
MPRLSRLVLLLLLFLLLLRFLGQGSGLGLRLRNSESLTQFRNNLNFLFYWMSKIFDSVRTFP